jgi:hypothetical protein
MDKIQNHVSSTKNPSRSQGAPSRSQGAPSQSQGAPSRSQGAPSNKKHSTDPAKILIGLLKLIVAPNIDSKKLITYVERYHINPDTYLPSLRGDMQLPLIYYCCCDSNLSEFFLYLLDRNVKLNTQIMCDDVSQQIELLYYSQITYIPTLIERGCRLNPIKVKESVEKMLIKGNIKKLIALHKYHAITRDQLLPILNQKGLVFLVLDQLYEKIYHISQQISDNPQKFNAVYDELLKNYINTFKFFFKNGVNINQIENGDSFVQKVLNTYFIPLIKIVIGDYHANLDSAELLHYSNFGLVNRQVMNIIYNEANYKVINEFIKDKITPKRIIIKKNLVKKVISQ